MIISSYLELNWDTWDCIYKHHAVIFLSVKLCYYRCVMDVALWNNSFSLNKASVFKL